MRNLKLLEKYQPPPPAIKKRKSQSTRKRKNITPCKSFNHPKIASTIMKKPQTPHLKSSQFLKKPYNSIGKIFNSFEVTRPIKPSPHEKISIPEKLTPFRKLQSCYIHVKIEINLPENISPPPQKSFKSPEQTQHHGNNPNPSRKNLKHFRKHLHPSKKI